MGLKVPEDLRKLISDVLQALLGKAAIPKEAIDTLSDHLRARRTNGMFEVFERSVKKQRREDRKVGREEGRKQATLENARAFKGKGVSDTIIAEALKLPPDVVAQL
jgi:hypothetical protein